MVQITPIREQRPGWREALIALLLLGWLGFTFAMLVQGETPVGRLSVQVVAKETGVPLAGARVYFNRGDERRSYTTDKNGRFIIASLNAGDYVATAESRAHRLEKSSFTLFEGEQKALVLALPPTQPFLELIHPQPVFLPTETPKIGLRGFVKTDRIQTDVLRVRIGADPNVATGEVFGLLDDIRLGWWRGEGRLNEKIAALGRTFESVRRESIPVSGRDVEGVFLQYVTFPVMTPGTYLMRLRAAALEEVALVVITDTGLVVKTVNGRELLTWTNQLKSGASQAGLKLEAWGDRRLAGRSRSTLLATALSSPDGLARLRLPPALDGVDRIYVVAQKGETREPLAWVSQNLDGRSELPSPLTGHIYSERPVYRPGNLVYLKGILRLHSDQGYALLSRGAKVALIVRDPDNNIVLRTETVLSGFSSFAARLKLNDEAKTGTYSVTAEVAGEEATGSFEVATYRKPTFQIGLAPRKKFFTAGESVRLDLKARYYFGLPVGESTVRYTVYRLPLYESTGPEEEDSESEGSYGNYGELVLDGTTRTDGGGQATIDFKPGDVPAGDARYGDSGPTNYRYSVSVSVQAAGNEYAESEANFPVVQGNLRLNLDTEPYFSQPNQPVRVKLAVSDRAKSAPQVVVVRWRTGIYEWDGDRSRIDWQSPSGEVKSDIKGEATWQFTPPRQGDWIVQVETRDEQGNAITAQSRVWVSSYGEAIPRGPGAPPLQLITDKRTYRVGERAKVAVRSQIPEATVLLTVEGDKLHKAQLVRLRGGSATVELPVKPGYVPTAYVSAALVQDKRFVQQSVPLRVGTEARQLQVQVTTDRTRYEPRERVQMRIVARTADGKPLSTELSVAVVDESLYAIREDKPQALFDSFYRRRPNQVETQYSFPWIALQGDKGSGDSVRRDFPDTAFWLPQVVTDRNGVALLSFVLPDNLTQWRVTAIAQSQATDVGFGVQRFTSARQFAVRLSVPPVLTEGDAVSVSAVVSNNGTAEQQANVQFAGDTRSIRVAPGQSQTVEWQYRAEQVGRIPLTVRAESDDGRKDAEERTITVLPHATEQVIARNLLLKPGKTGYPFTVAPNFLASASRLEVRLAPSIFSQLLGTLDYLVGYPYGCTEQTMSRFLPSLAVMRVLREKSIALPELEQRTPEVIEKGLARLYRFQHSDGGWGWWEDDDNDLFMSAYVMHGLAVSRSSGVAVNEEVYRLGRESLLEQVRSTWETGFAKKERFARDTYAFALYALSLTGAPPPNKSAELRTLTKQLTPYGKAMLVLAFNRWGSPAQAEPLVAELLAEQQQSDTGIFWQPRVPGETLKPGWFDHNWLNDTETTSWVLLALLRHSNGESLDLEKQQSVVNWLLAHREAQGWESTKDSAAALEALLAYASRSGEPLATATTLRVLLNGEPVGEQRFDARSAWLPEVTMKLPVRLPVGENQLEFEVEGNPLYAGVNFVQALRLEEEASPVNSGPLKLERTYALMRSGTGPNGSPRFDETPLRSGETVGTGALVRVRVRVTGWGANSNISHLILEDPLPGGFRTTDASLPTESSGEAEYGYSDYTTEIRDDRVIGYYRKVYGKTLEFEYLLRAEVPGDYHVLPSRLWSMYSDWRLTGLEMRLKIRPE